jgi:hypothetical protein
MIKSKYSNLELYNLWIAGNHIDELCNMAGISDRKTLYKRFDRLRNNQLQQQEYSTNSTQNVENIGNSQATEVVKVDNVDNIVDKSVDKVDNSLADQPTKDTGETVDGGKLNPLALLLGVIIGFLISLGIWLYCKIRSWWLQRQQQLNYPNH